MYILVNPTTVAISTGGPTVDAGADLSQSQFVAVQQIGDLEEEGTLDGKMQESSNGSDWVDISGATFTQVTADNHAQSIQFTRKRRYLRLYMTVAGAGVVFTVSAALFPLGAFRYERDNLVGAV